MTAFERTLGSILAAYRPIAVRSWLVAVGSGGGFYGAVMGGFGGLSADRAVQVAYSAAKLPLLLLATTLLATPSFFVLNSLLGLRNDFGAAFRAVLGTQAAIAIILAALAPYTAVWYLSTTDYHEATAFNALMLGSRASRRNGNSAGATENSKRRIAGVR